MGGASCSPSGAADLRLGALEIQRIAAMAAQDSTIEAYGVLSVAKDPRAAPRERKSYDDRTLFRIRVEKIEDTYVARLTDRVEAAAQRYARLAAKLEAARNGSERRLDVESETFNTGGIA